VRAKPAVVIAVLLGIVNDLEILPIQIELLVFLKLVGNTLLISLAAYIIHRVIHDVALYYGELRARRDEPRPDDWILPIARLVSPIVLVVVVALVVLPAWGLDIGAVLAGAGLTGLVLGLALQDSVGNIFAGVGLLTDAPFALGDLIVLPSGAAADQIVRVDRIGLRTTEVYHIEQHASISCPTRICTMQIKNITKPTVDLGESADRRELRR
jgi:MscS family membrane protein